MPSFSNAISSASILTSKISLFKPFHNFHSHSSTLSYGPSLKRIPEYPEGNQPQVVPNYDTFDEEMFTRTFEISAVRVPSDMCFPLESRLSGHLLNWPRVPNVARILGDDIDQDLSKLLDDKSTIKADGEEGNVASLDQKIHGHDKGDGEPLSSHGFMKFNNFANMMRPKNGKDKKSKGIRKKDYVMVEVVEGDHISDLKGILGEEFSSGTGWTGPTRLLLLDDWYANKGLDDMAGAIKALLNEGFELGTISKCELVRCKLTLFYNYWQLSEILVALLPKGMIIPSSFETVGHIAHLNLKDEHLPYKKLIAKAILDKNRAKLKTVVNKIDAIHNDYRTMPLEVLIGNHSLVTTVIENGMRFNLDLATVYWNSKLGTERQRLVSCFSHDDIVCDVFCGVGPITLSAAKKVKCVYANDLNPHAVHYLQNNSILNKLNTKIEPFNMDARKFIDTIFRSQNANSITQVVMNLPNNAVEYLDAFQGVYGHHQMKDKEPIFPIIHIYGFSTAQDPEFDFHERISTGLWKHVDVKMHKVRLVAPGKWMLCASFILPKSVAYEDSTHSEN